MRYALFATMTFFLILSEVTTAAEIATDRVSLCQLGQDAKGLTNILNPAPEPKACNVSRDCGNGTSVACQGIYSCVHSPGGVSCDGSVIQCPSYIPFRCEGGINARLAAASCCLSGGEPGENPPPDCVHNWCVRQCCSDVYGIENCNPNGDLQDIEFTACMGLCGPVAAMCTCGGDVR